MRWRLIVLGCLAVALAIGFAVCTNATVDLDYRAQQIYANTQDGQPGQRELDLSTRLYQQAFGLQIMMTPLAAGSLISGLAIPAVLARRWQLREAAASDAQRTSA